MKINRLAGILAIWMLLLNVPCAAAEPVEGVEAADRLDMLVHQLDADRDGRLDAAMAVGEDAEISIGNAGEFAYAAAPADAFSVTAGGEGLFLAALKPGEASLVMTDGEQSRELAVDIADYRVEWVEEAGAVLYVGEPVQIAACADPANTLEGTVVFNGEATAVTSQGNLTYTPAGVGRMTVSLSVAGRDAGTREYAVHYRLSGEIPEVTLKTPFFGEQDGQTVRVLNAAGEPVPLEDFEASESGIVSVILGENRESLIVTPKATGEETVTLTHRLSGQTAALKITVKNTFAEPGFRVSAAAGGVCLAGLIAMIALMKIKLGGRKR